MGPSSNPPLYISPANLFASSSFPSTHQPLISTSQIRSSGKNSFAKFFTIFSAWLANPFSQSFSTTNLSDSLSLLSP
ncbi:hypothetical protein F8388_001226 [Cannabis sativa]|uniref:Uncharacterized protein n=1 Tax=Cannabis sativa TaxID=3483 RepID=A0A7J6GGJ1_CANSA|nr:hypothetical protein F8388_001226 [Cannabis sativa]